MRRCRKCVTYLESDALSCPACGAPTPPDPPPDQLCESPSQPFPTDDPPLLKYRGVELEKKWWPRAVGTAARLGFGIGFVFTLLGSCQEILHGGPGAIWMAPLYLIVYPIMCAVLFVAAVVIGILIIEVVRGLFDWGQEPPKLPPHAYLAKTDSLQGGPRVQGEDSGILTPDSLPLRGATGLDSGIQRQDLQPP
jgi:hypothetical protein